MVARRLPSSEAKPTMLAPKEQPRWLRFVHKIDRLIYSSKGSPMWTYDYRIAFFLHIPDKQQRLGFLKEMSTKQVAVYKRELKKAYHEAIAQDASALLVSSKRPSKPTADRPIEITEALKPIVLDHEELLCWFEERLAEAAPRRHKQPPKNTFGSRGGTSRITRWRQQKEQQQKALEAKELLAKKQIRRALLRYINETEASFLAGMLPKRGTPKLIRKPIVPKKTSS
jgi:hypothetical protein